jgi:CubicO group peptidase (beta-lactamase class C family)
MLKPFPAHPRQAARPLLIALAVATTLGACAATQPRSFPRVQPEQAGFSAEGLARIRPALQALVDTGMVAGVVTVVARDGSIVHEEEIGRFDSERPEPLTSGHLFRIYSMTKPVTAVAIMKLQEQGRLHIDDPVSKYIPAFASVQVYAGGPSTSPQLRAPARAPTIADLLSHSSGLTYGAFGNSPVDSMYQRAGLLSPARTLEQFADAVAALPLLFSPGERWLYSVGQDVAGRVVEVASGMTFGEYLQQDIFGPLGMTSTSFFIREGQQDRLMPIHHPAPGGRVRPRREVGAGFERTARLESGGGGLISTPGDFLKFAQMLLNGGQLDGVRILSPASVATISRNRLPDAIRGTTLAGRSHGFGLSVAVQADPPTGPGSAAGTYWWAGMANTNFWIDPENRVIGMIFTQQLPSGRDGGAYATFRRLVYEALER